jgi:hypothetical protein
MNDFAAYCWTIVMVVAVLIVGFSATVDTVFTGSNIPAFTTARNITIEGAKTVNVTAISEEKFILSRDGSDDTITGGPVQPSLACPHTTCFAFGPKDVPSGHWDFPVGSATFSITSDQPVTITLVERSTVAIWFAISIIGFIFWLLILAWSHTL